MAEAAAAPIDVRRYPVLYVDDEPDNLDAFRFSFRRGFDLRGAASGAEALEILAELDAAVLVVDQRMPQMSGLELLHAARKLRPDVVGILLTAYTDIEVIVEALNSGLVYRYVTKPWDSQELKVILRQAIERHALFRENQRLLGRLAELNRYLDGELRERFHPGRIAGRSAALAAALDSLRSVAATDATVLLRGPSGTGKELFARAVHDNSPRAEGPFVRVACAALSPGVLESELFGHEKGAFTGAHQRKLGRFELAEGGTLFLDEIGDLPEETQVKLLRVLQEREFERVGGTQTLKMNARLVAATHQNLEQLIGLGRFREDLYFRINVFPIFLPPLRERLEDIPLLAEQFLEHYRHRFGKEHPQGFSAEALDRLLAHSWPGNVRELENLVERAVILARGPLIGPELIQLPQPPAPSPALAELRPGASLTPLPGATPTPPPGAWPWPGAPAAALPLPGPSAGGPPQDDASLASRMDELERRELIKALQLAGGSKAEAARMLGVNRSTLYYRLKKHGLGEE